MRENKMINSLRKINCIMIDEKIAELIDNIVIMHIKDSIKVQLINVNSKMRKNLFYFLTKKGRTFPLVKISFFERY